MNNIFEEFSACLAPEQLFVRIAATLPEQRLELSTAEDPSPMDTLGTLIDKLITVDMKMWHNQEVLYAIRRMDLETFARIYENDMSKLHQIIKRCCDLNVQRATLMDAIDKLLTQIVTGQQKAEVREQHKTY